MAWNEPGGGKEHDPWGGGRNNQGPPDLDEILRRMQQRVSGLFGKRGGNNGRQAGGIALLLVIGLLAWLAYDMVYIIQPAQRGVVLRFGKYEATLPPGPNVRMPRPFETVEKVDVDQVRTIEIGYRSAQGQRASTVPTEALMLTQDENIVDLRVAVQYRVDNPRDYLFNVRDPDSTLKQIAESSLREVVGKHEMDFVLKEGRADIVARTQSLMQQIADRYGTGLHVMSVNLVDAQPPEQVQGAFLDAIKAREDQQRIVNEGEAYANDVLPRARGGAARAIEDARAYRAKKTSMAEGDAKRFQQVEAAYAKAPDVTRKRLYLETMQDVLSRSSKVLIEPKGNNLVYLPLDRLMAQHKGAAAAQGTQGDGAPASAPGTGAASDMQTSSDQQDMRGRIENSFQSGRERERR